MEARKIDPIWKKKDVVGIDIGTHSIKAVQLHQQGKLTKLIAYGKIELPENYVIEGIISEPEKVAKLIADMFVSTGWGKFTASRVITSLSESKIFTRILTLPRMGNKDLAEAISWEASQYLPLALTDLYLDWQIVGTNKKEADKLDVLFAAAPKSIVDSFLQTFAIANLEVSGVEPSLTAIARAMIPQREKNETVLVIDIGAETSNIAIFDSVIRVTGSTVVGGNDLLRVPAKIVTRGTETEKKKEVSHEFKINETSEMALQKIVQEATQVIKYYEEKTGQKDIISRILLCGGPASFPGLVDYFKEKLGIQTAIGNPWSNISVYPIKPVPKEEAPSYTNAIGLALAGAKDE